MLTTLACVSLLLNHILQIEYIVFCVVASEVPLHSGLSFHLYRFVVTALLDWQCLFYLDAPVIDVALLLNKDNNSIPLFTDHKLSENNHIMQLS